MSRPSLLEAAQFLPVPLRRQLIRCILLFRRKALFLQAGDFRGKRVLILGPARSATDDLAGVDTSRYDVVVRFNNGLDTPVPPLGEQQWRCDIIFHSLSDEARPVTGAALRRAGVRWLVHRTPTQSSYLHTLIAARDFARVVEVKCLPPEHYNALRSRLNGVSPTSGLVCASFFLSAPVEELAIVGFTFFTTRYLPGYDDSVSSDGAARRAVAERGHHNPALEARLLMQDVAAARDRGCNVVLGPHVIHALGGAA